MQLGRYQVLRQLATGDVADVHLARASGLEGFARHVVLKAIRPELAHEERLVEAFLEEARIAAALHHQNVVQVHDIGEQDGAYFFAMEYVHGEDVRKLLGKVRERGEQVPLEHVVAIVTATAAGLHHAHEQRSPTAEPLGLVHRDVCPANILLGYDGSVKLVDFGMAKAGLRSTKTASGALKSKASYMSPEQCVGRVVDRRTDTFALGIVLYELLTARRLFKGANEYMTMAAIVEGDVPPPSRHRADLPAALDEIVLRALARAPESRYQTAEALREALERFAIEHELRTSNKALADYMIALFGVRPEPWQTDAELPAPVAKYDIANDSGLVAAPDGDDLITRESPHSTAPIMLAQTMRDGAVLDAGVVAIDDGWDDDGEPPTTTLTDPAPAPTLTDPAPSPTLTEPARLPTPTEPAQLPTLTGPTPVPAMARDSADEATSSRVTADDADGATIVAPPVFIHEDPTAQREPSELAAVREVTAAAANADNTRADNTDTITNTDDDVATLDIAAGRGEREPERPLPAPLVHGGPPRPSSEHLYIGPPAPSANPIVALRRLSATHRSVIVAASAGMFVLLLAVIAMRACG